LEGGEHSLAIVRVYHGQHSRWRGFSYVFRIETKDRDYRIAEIRERSREYRKKGASAKRQKSLWATHAPRFAGRQ
jgi:hypothetical protein